MALASRDPAIQRRRLAPIAIAAVAAAIGLVVWVAVSSREALALARAGRALVAETEALARTAAEQDPRARLASLPASRWNGSHVLLEDLLAEAKISATGLGPLPPVLAFELDSSDRVAMSVVGGRSRQREGTLVVTGDRNVHLRAGGLALATREVGEVEIRVRVARGKRLWLSFVEENLEAWPGDPRGPCCLQPPWDRVIRRVLVDVVPDGELHTYRIDGSQVIGGLEMSRATTLFLHPTDTDDEIEIDYLRFHPRLADFGRSGVRVGPATQGRETRSAIGCLSPCSLAFDVPVPVDRPQLALGYSILDDGRPVDFELAIVDGDRDEVLIEESVTRSGAWTDRRFDLAAWTGRTATVRLKVTTPADRAVGFWSSPVVYSRPERPFNVLMVAEDMLRADHLSVYGHARRTSPVKEALAARGVVFEHAFSQAPATRPSVPSFMTSLYPGSTGVWTFQHSLDDAYLTLAEVMRSQGFATASFVENPSAGAGARLAQGFERVLLEGWERESEGLYGELLPRFIAANRDRNWFVYTHVLDPHFPYDPEPPWDHWYRDEGPGTTPAPRMHTDPPSIASPTREGRRLLYDGEIERNDHWFGKLLAAIDAEGLRENTLIVFLSDHGEHLGEHRAPGDNRGLYGHYAPTFATTIHVPLLLSWPGVLPEGVRVSGAVPLIDVMPTILDLAGIDRSALVLQGHSLLPAIELQQSDSERVIVSEEPEHFADRDRPQVSASLFFRGWQLVASRRLEHPLRYDLVADPQQSAPLPRGPRGLAIEWASARLLRDFADAQVSLRRALAGGGPEDVVYDPEEMERLRALGYLE